MCVIDAFVFMTRTCNTHIFCDETRSRVPEEQHNFKKKSPMFPYPYKNGAFQIQAISYMNGL